MNNKIIDELSYRCYKFNRQEAPDISAQRYVPIFGKKVYEFERRLRQDALQDEHYRAKTDPQWDQ